MSDTHTTAHIPDEAVQAAKKAVFERCKKTYLTDDQMFAALTSALPHLSVPCAVEVKPSSFVNAANILASDAPHIVVQKLDAAYSQIVTKPVDVPALLQEVRSGERDGFINTGQEPHGNDADLSCPCCGGSGHKDDAKPVDVAAVRRQAIDEVKSLCAEYGNDSQPESEYRLACNDLIEALCSLSAEPVQGDHFANVSNMVEALKETRIDLVVLSGNIADAAKSSDKWEGMYDRVRSWIDRIDAALPAAPTTEAGK